MKIGQVTGPGPNQLFIISVEEPTSPGSRAGKPRNVRAKSRPSWYEPKPDRESASPSFTSILITNSPPPRVSAEFRSVERRTFGRFGRAEEISIPLWVLSGRLQTRPGRLWLYLRDDSDTGRHWLLYRPTAIPEGGARDEDGKEEEEGAIPTPIHIATPADVEPLPMDMDIPMDVEP
ncbi:hypothetical protein PQX77_003443 [Marasmius sp. AFHP31]|nr:hypothetical protein PQX77_003443 [Marasmius sp. AFHP31]